MSALQRMFIASLAIMFDASCFAADRYEVTARRVNSNLYQVSPGNLLVQTSGCLSLAMLDKAILSQTEINFPDERESCIVRQILKPMPMVAGRYSVIVSFEDTEWYSIDFGKFYAKTLLCLELALGQKAILEWSGAFGKIGFLDSSNKTCRVEAIYSVVRLP